MDIIKAPTKISAPVYRAQFKYIPPSLGSDKIEKGTTNESEIQQRLSGNIIEVGQPECWNLKELCTRKRVNIPEKIRMLTDRYDFWLIQSAFAFIPAHGSKFTWARIVTVMEALPDISGDPIAYDAFPKNIYEEKYKDKEINVGLNFKFKTVVETKADYIQKIELTKLEPLISVAGIGKTKPTWDFRGKAAFSLKDVNALYMIVKTPVHSKGLKLSFFSHAEISTKWGGLFPTTSKPKGEDSYEVIFPIGT